MKLSVYLAKDKSRLQRAQRETKAPVAEMKGVPARVTTFTPATRSHGAEALVVLDRGRILSVVASAGEMRVYLSPRSRFRAIEPDPSPSAEPRCEACERGEKTITPPHSSIVGSLPVHTPSGMLCAKFLPGTQEAS
jgi:hypothetical protein